MSISNLLLDYIEQELTTDLVDSIPEDDIARAGAIKQGPLQGDPDPDEARVSIELYENDPDSFYKSAFTSMTGAWRDEVDHVECGGAIIWNRRFTIKARCLLVNTQEDLEDARDIGSTVKTRIERCLLGLNFNSVYDSQEFVSRNVVAQTMQTEMVQGGGPDAYDFSIKVRFDVQTSQAVT